MRLAIMPDLTSVKSGIIAIGFSVPTFTLLILSFTS